MINPELFYKVLVPVWLNPEISGSFCDTDIVHARISVLHTNRSLTEIFSWNAQPLKSSEGQGHFLGVIWTFSRGGFLELFSLSADPASKHSGNPDLQG